METPISPNAPQCRICLKTGSSKLLSLYHSPDYDEESPRLMLSKFGITLEDEDCLNDLPKQICKNCNCELNLSYQFFEKATQAQLLIQQYLDAKHNKEILITETKDIENVELGENVSTKSLAKQNLENFTAIEEVVEFFDEECNEYIPLETSVDDIVPTKSEASELNNTINSGKSSISTKKSNAIAVNLHKKKRKQGRKSFSEIVIEPVVKKNAENLKNLSKRGRKSKTGEDTKCHVCEICGNVFKKRGRLTEHLRRHETELKYICELCDERFLLREALRRHMFTHLGEKPFKCGYCSRQFFYESVKKAHEAVHEGHKPYICEQEHCKKAFAYPHALKRHELIHADIKLYSCKFCKKDFRLQHHMQQHEKTKAHIYAVQTAKLNKQ